MPQIETDKTLCVNPEFYLTTEKAHGTAVPFDSYPTESSFPPAPPQTVALTAECSVRARGDGDNGEASVFLS
jgi:hypothetical protein